MQPGEAARKEHGKQDNFEPTMATDEDEDEDADDDDADDEDEDDADDEDCEE